MANPFRDPLFVSWREKVEQGGSVIFAIDINSGKSIGDAKKATGAIAKKIEKVASKTLGKLFKKWPNLGHPQAIIQNTL